LYLVLEKRNEKRRTYRKHHLPCSRLLVFQLIDGGSKMLDLTTIGFFIIAFGFVLIDLRLRRLENKQGK
jgi:hypothetical protein